MLRSVLGTLAILATTSAISAFAQAPANPDCRLDVARSRIDRTVASLKVDSKNEAEIINALGAVYRAIDYKFSGEIEGCVVLAGPISALKRDYSSFTDAPDITFPQEHMLSHPAREPYKLPLSANDGNSSPRYFAKGRFLGQDGAGFNLFLPKLATDWNGKLFVAQRGSGVYEPLNPLVPRGASDPFPSNSGLNQFVENMMDRGYAVVYLRKDAARPPLGVSKATLSNGHEITARFSDHAGLPLAMIEFAQRELTEAFGREPTKTYYYGHSGGGISGRIMNYTGANVARDGTPIIDGFILDDSGNGLYLPVVFHNGADILFMGDEKRTFVPQIEITRQLYNPQSYLIAKRLNSEMLAGKALGEKHRYYEVQGISHFDSGMAPRNIAGQSPNLLDFLDLSGFMTATIDNLDAWITKGVVPPPGPSAGIALPEVVCPLGIYHAPTISNGATTKFIPFDGNTMEPVTNSLSGTFDANRNGITDRMETVTIAWRRLNLVRANEKVDSQTYFDCIRNATLKLIDEKFLPAGAQAWHLNRATSMLANLGARID